MTDTPNDDKPGFVTEEPVRCFACFCLIRPGQTYCLSIEHEALCVDCTLVEGVPRVRGDLVVEVKRDRRLVHRGRAEPQVFPGEIRHLVNALVQAAARLVDQEAQEGQHSHQPARAGERADLLSCPYKGG